jgi:hypothetical protein
MRVHPAIAALRSNRAPQRQAQAAVKQACDAWCGEPSVAQALEEFQLFGSGASLEACPTLDQIFTGQGRAEAMAQSLVRNLCAAMARLPFAHPPFRHGFDGRASTLLLAKSGRAQLLLQAREPGQFDFPCATFSDALRYDATLAGEAQARILRIHGARDLVRFAEEEVALRPGVRLGFDCTSETVLAHEVSKRLVTLRLLQASESPQPGREYCLQTGKLLHQSAGSLATSRREMMVALLGRMERAEAAPVMAGMVRTESDESLRWQCLRECLALDSEAGFATLSAIAASEIDPLADPARALRTQLIEDHPQFLQMEASPCRG